MWRRLAATAVVLAMALWSAASGERGAARARASSWAAGLDANDCGVVRHLQEADATARRRPSSAAAVGALALAYHAEGFNDQAAECYGVAADLAPGDWRWKYYLALVDIDRGGLERVPERLVRRVRRATDDRQRPWTYGELEALK
jgi:hypothetical protein